MSWRRVVTLFLCLFFLKVEGSAQFHNPGVYSVKQNGVLYEWIPSEFVSVEINDGRVRIICPEFKTSWNGKNQCRRFLFGDLYDNMLPEAEVHALLGDDGLALPPGNYAFRIMYANVGDYGGLRSNLWNLMGRGSGTADDNSAMMETLYLSITSNSAVATGISVPQDLLRASWLPHYQLLPYDLKLPADKAFGVTRYVAGIPKKDLFKKFTHIQYVFRWADQVAPSHKWRNIQAYDHSGKLAQPSWVIANSIVDKNFITVAELAENYGNLENDCPRCYEKAEEVFKGLYGRYQKELGVKSPAETRLYDDYFGALYGYSHEMNFNAPIQYLRRGLSSKQLAQSRYSNGRMEPSYYFSKGAHAYRNYRMAGYIGNFFNTVSEGGLYKNIYNLEKTNLAVPDRKILKNGWHSAEALGIDRVTDAGTFQRLKLNGGDILRVQPNGWPLHTMLAESFFQLLLGNDYVLWNSNIPMSVDPADFSQSWYGGFDRWKTKWQPTGKPATEYNPDNRSHPRLKKGPEGSQFPEMSMQGETGAFIGAWLYSQISTVSDRVSRYVGYCNFSVNGKSYRPKAGQKGDQSLSSRVAQNEGQDWIVTSYEQKNPICICTEGKDGKAVIYQNPHAGLTGVQKLVTSNGLTTEFSGNRMHLFYVD
jgi:hypothetical protein